MVKVLKNKYLSLHWMLQTYGAWNVSFSSLRFRSVLRQSIFRLIVLVGPQKLDEDEADDDYDALWKKTRREMRAAASATLAASVAPAALAALAASAASAAHN